MCMCTHIVQKLRINYNIFRYIISMYPPKKCQFIWPITTAIEEKMLYKLYMNHAHSVYSVHTAQNFQNRNYLIDCRSSDNWLSKIARSVYFHQFCVRPPDVCSISVPCTHTHYTSRSLRKHMAHTHMPAFKYTN